MTQVDLVVLGGGPAGYVGALRAAQLKRKVAVVEDVHLGGICLNYGCIPTKALLKTAEMYRWMLHDAKHFGLTVPSVAVDFLAVIARSRNVVDQLQRGVSGLLRKARVDAISGRGTLKDPHTLSVRTPDGKSEDVRFQHLMIATGAVPRTIPHITPDGTRILTYKEAMLLDAPPKTLTVIGAGAIGVEFAYFFASFGTKVTLVEMMDRMLPQEDIDVSQAVADAFRSYGIEILTTTRVEDARIEKHGVTITLSSGKQVVSEKVLLSVGVAGNTAGLGLDSVGVNMAKDHILVNEMFQTSVPHIYAVGDVIGPPWLAHVASHEAITAAEHMAGLAPKPIAYTHVPACTYCQPQVASIGLTEAAAREKGHDVQVGKFPFRANGKALAAGTPEGFVKLIFDAKYGELLGAHLVGHDVTEMMGTFSVMMAGEVTRDELIHAIHPHPTCSEAVVEAALDSIGRALHI